MDVLVAIPTGKRLFDHAVRGIFLQERDSAHRMDVVFVSGGDTSMDARERVAAKYNRVRDIFLAGTWSHLWTVESDMVIPLDALKLLEAADADVAYGLYCFRRKPHEWNAYSVIDGMEAIPLTAAPDRAKADWGGVVEVDGIGFGCTLIRRHVLQSFPFRIGEETHADGERSHCDWYFAADCFAAGFVQRCHTAVVCGHVTEWDAEGNVRPCVIWPDIDSPTWNRFEVME